MQSRVLANCCCGFVQVVAANVADTGVNFSMQALAFPFNKNFAQP
jgi:hypothetical protein